MYGLPDLQTSDRSIHSQQQPLPGDDLDASTMSALMSSSPMGLGSGLQPSPPTVPSRTKSGSSAAPYDASPDDPIVTVDRRAPRYAPGGPLGPPLPGQSQLTRLKARLPAR